MLFAFIGRSCELSLSPETEPANTVQQWVALLIHLSLLLLAYSSLSGRSN